MGGKFSPVIIIVLLLVVVAIGILMFQILSGPSTGQPDTEENTVEEEAEPILTLDKVTNADGTVKIVATGSIEDELGIKSIVLPDKNVTEGDTAEFVVEENGKYTFIVRANNGKESSSDITVTEIEGPSSTKPYIPEGFEAIDGDVENGYVIGDSYGNQYVWVPVPSGKLKRNTSMDTKYEEVNSAASALVNSVARYYGFYIGRFEASEYELNGKKLAASMGGKTPWTDITCDDATGYANQSADGFGYNDETHTAIINSYAWDTTVAWIEEKYEGYSSSTKYGNYEGMILPTGTTDKDKLRKICDLSGNVREWTSEKFLAGDNSSNNKKDANSAGNTIYRVVRGGCATLSRTPSSHIGYPENTSDLYWGFRMILYKQ